MWRALFSLLTMHAFNTTKVKSKCAAFLRSGNYFDRFRKKLSISVYPPNKQILKLRKHKRHYINILA